MCQRFVDRMRQKDTKAASLVPTGLQGRWYHLAGQTGKLKPREADRLAEGSSSHAVGQPRAPAQTACLWAQRRARGWDRGTARPEAKGAGGVGRDIKPRPPDPSPLGPHFRAPPRGSTAADGKPQPSRGGPGPPPPSAPSSGSRQVPQPCTARLTVQLEGQAEGSPSRGLGGARPLREKPVVETSQDGESCGQEKG